MAYQLVNVFCRLAGNVSAEREAFYEAVAACNEHEGMPRGILLTPLSIGAYGPEHRNAVDENIRLTRFFLLVVEDIWDVPAASFLRDYRVALKCRTDEAMPMREMAVAIKRTPADEEPGDLAQFRAGLTSDGAPHVVEFTTMEEFRGFLAPLLSEWLVTVKQQAAAH
jgi:hypothetical protein